MRSLLRPLIAVLAGFLAACGGGRGVIDPVQQAGHWRLEGRLAVSDGRDSGSGSLTWEQEGAYYRIELRAPVSGQSWRLSGDGTLCTLEGLRPYPIHADSPEQLLQRELGWRLPVASLRDWLQGRPLHDQTVVSRDPQGRVSGFEESGWQVEYRDFREGRPTRITARRPPHQVRLAIRSWIVLP